MTETILCESCGLDFTDDHGFEAQFSPFHSNFSGLQADLIVECPNCADLLEVEVTIDSPITHIHDEER